MVMQKNIVRIFFVSVLFLYTPAGMCMNFLKSVTYNYPGMLGCKASQENKESLVVDPATMDSSKLLVLKQIQTESLFIFKLLTCAQRQPSEVKEAISQEVKTVYGFRHHIKLPCEYEVEKILPSSAYKLVRDPFSKFSVWSVDAQVIANKLEDQGGACKEFKRLIVAQLALQETEQRSHAEAAELAQRARLLEAMKKADK
jgi:hypothetical protein